MGVSGKGDVRGQASNVRIRFVWALFFSIAVVVCVPLEARAETRPIGFANLVFRLENDRIGIASGDFGVYVVEALRGAGVTAVGAENLVFNKDDSSRAELLLGGTVRELECLDKSTTLSCRVGIQWQVLDVGGDRVVYELLARHVEYDVPKDSLKVLGKKLVVGAVGSLLKRQGFRSLLAQNEKPPPGTSYPRAAFRPCAAAPLALPDASSEAMRSTVFIRAHDGFASGFFLGSDGLVLTAAHAVTQTSLDLELRDGTKLKARPVRLSKHHDAALLVIDGKAGGYPCLPLDLEPKSPGREVYAIGAPASEKLAFSLTRGIVSGLPEIDGLRLLQTDASVNPGNSGGPLVDAKGRIVALVSRKFVGVGIEGVAFGVPIELVLDGLGLSRGLTTEDALTSAEAIGFRSHAAAAVPADEADPVASLDPAAEEAERVRQAELKKKYEQAGRPVIHLVRWGGLVLAAAGAVGAVLTAQELERDKMTASEYSGIRLKNDLCWVLAGAGTAGFVASWFMSDGTKAKPGRTKAEVRLSPAGAHARVRF
jgi:serine protease Do